MMPMLQSIAREAARSTRSPWMKLASLTPRRVSARLARLSQAVLPRPLAMRLIAHHERRWGEPELRLLRHLVPHDAVAVDVGAAEGVYSWFLVRYARECHAFEAHPESAAAIRGRVPRARIHGCALSDRAGELELRIPIVAGIPYFGWATTQPTNRFPALPDHEIMVIRVPCAPLDSFGLENVGFMKIDVEGHELAVLSGAIGTLRASRPNLLIEAEDRHRPDALRLVRDFLTPLGYEGFFLHGKRLIPVDQLGKADVDLCTRYVNNFVFMSDGRFGESPVLRSLCAVTHSVPNRVIRGAGAW
jgi:FkbM family methyltransferase